MSNRSGNKGECANSCRWNYSLVEEKRPGEYMPVYEDARGTQIMSAFDLKMIEYLDILKKAGVSSFKLEGRMKGINYAAGVVKVYREALDLVNEGGDLSANLERWNCELSQFSNRGFTTGMYLGDHPDSDYTFDGPAYIKSESELAGVIGDTDFELPVESAPSHSKDRFAVFHVRNTLKDGDNLFFLSRGSEDVSFPFKAWHFHVGRELEGAKNEDTVIIKIPENVSTGDVVRVIKKKV
jgi:putative protease